MQIDSAATKLRVFVARSAREAYVVASGSELSRCDDHGVQTMRRDVLDGTLPVCDWRASMVGQRARVLVGNHKWTEAIITALDAATPCCPPT